MAALHRAVTLKEVDHVAVAVGHDLHLNVLRVNHGALDVDIRVTESSLRLTRRLSCKLLYILDLLNEAHAAAATTGNCLHKHRELEILGILSQLLRVRRRLRVLQRRQASTLSSVDSGRLITSQIKGLSGRANELDALLFTAAGKVRTLRQEPVAGVHSIRAGLFCRTDDFFNVQVRLDRLALNTDLNRFVRERAVERVTVLTWVDRNGLRTCFKGGAKRAHRDLTAVSHQDLFKGGKFVQRKRVRIHRFSFRNCCK